MGNTCSLFLCAVLSFFFLCIFGICFDYASETQINLTIEIL